MGSVLTTATFTLQGKYSNTKLFLVTCADGTTNLSSHDVPLQRLQKSHKLPYKA